MRVLAAHAPTRVDFGGGWTDVPPYCIEQGGCVCAVAIARYATVELSDAGPPGPEHTGAESGITASALAKAGVSGVSLSVNSDFPIGSGLGGSSAAGVAAVGALAAWSGQPIEPADLAERSRAIEVEDMGIPGGRQDHYAAAFGGALGLTFGDSTTVMRIPISPATVEALESRCTIIYTGQSRISGENITAVLDAYRAREPVVTGALARMRELAQMMIAALMRGAIDDLGALVGEHWVHQRSLHPAIATPRIDAIIHQAIAGGAFGAKALGASGGGCVLIIAPPDRTPHIRHSIAELGVLLPMTVDHEGFRVLRGAEMNPA